MPTACDPSRMDREALDAHRREILGAIEDLDRKEQIPAEKRALDAEWAERFGDAPMPERNNT